MIVYEFYLKEQFKEQPFDAICDSFYNLGNVTERWDNPVDPDTGAPVNASAVYSVSRNPRTHWVQILVDDNTSKGILTAIRSRIKGLSDGKDIAEYTNPQNSIAPRERTRGKSLEVK